MDETSTTAMLVGTREAFATRSDALTATVPRDEIEAALTSEPPDELVLDVLRTVEGAEAPERRTVNVAWNRTDLEMLLEDADSQAITFSFDPTELEKILSEPEVEGHGLREAAAVLSIAAAAAAAGSSSASAMYGEPGVAGPTAQQQIVVSGHDEATIAQRGIEPGTLAATHDEMTLAARGVGPAAPADETVADTGSRFDLPSVDPAIAAGLAGALAAFGLAIAGASFASRRREPGAV